MKKSKCSRLLPLLLMMTLVLPFCFAGSVAVAAEDVTMFVQDEAWYDEIRYGKAKIDNLYYVPTSFFARIDGLEVKTSTQLRNVMLTYGEKYITFDTETRKIAYTEELGSIYLPTYMIRPGTLWIPAQAIANFFGLVYEETSYDGRDIIRIRDGNAAHTLNELIAAYYAAPPEVTTEPVTSEPPEVTTAPPEIEERTIHLTFEGCPNENTGDILDLLGEYGCKATFFLDGSAVPDHLPLIRRMLLEGHTVGLGTMTGDTRGYKKDFSLLLGELEEENALLEKAFHLRSRLICIPGGSASSRSDRTITQENGNLLEEAGYIVWDWNVNVRDVAGYTIPGAAQTAEKEIEKYSIPVLRFHSTDKTAAVLAELLEYIGETPGCRVQPITAASVEINFIGLYE